MPMLYRLVALRERSGVQEQRFRNTWLSLVATARRIKANTTAALERTAVRNIEPRRTPAAANANHIATNFPCTCRPRLNVQRNAPQQTTSSGIKRRSFRRKVMPATPSAPLTAGSPRHTTAHRTAPRAPLVSQIHLSTPKPLFIITPSCS